MSSVPSKSMSMTNAAADLCAGGTVPVGMESDIAESVRLARRVAQSLGYSATDVSYIATAAAELASNLYVHAEGGVFQVRTLDDPPGLELATLDKGPGIPDVALAMREGYSTAGGLGCGLPGVKRLMDTLEIDTAAGRGTRVSARKWR